MLFQEVEETFNNNAIKCGSHKKMLSDLKSFNQEMDIDTLKSVKFLDGGVELDFDISIKNDLIINLPKFYPFQKPEIFVLDLGNNDKIELREFIKKNNQKNIEKTFSKLDKMFIQDIPSINLVDILDEVMIILKPVKLGWLFS